MSTSAVEELLGQLPLSQLATQLGVEPQAAAQAAAATIPSLIGGLQHNADQGQEQAVAGALAQHRSSTLLDSGSVDLTSVDTTDGAKIVQHIFGDQSTQLAHAVGQTTGANGGLVNQLLPILAPVVLAYLAKKVPVSEPGGSGSGPLGTILGGILSGGGVAPILDAGHPGQTADPMQGGAMDEPQPSDVTETAPPSGDRELQSGDETPGAPGEDHPAQPQSSSSIVDEILGGIFGTH